MTDEELLLFDRLEVIRKTIEKYGVDNFYLSFSGGKDSTVVHHLLDMALPGNNIPRVFSNTGIEYQAIVEYVLRLAESDKRFQIIKPTKNIKATLNKYGYPFKSKQYSQWYMYYQRNPDRFLEIRKEIEKRPELLNDFNFIHNLPKGTKWLVKEYYGKRERERFIRVFWSSLKY